jgi:hypothetical protein
MEFDRMKRIALFVVCGMLLLVANTAEARRSRNSGMTYSQPVYAQPVYAQAKPATAAATSTTTGTKTVKVAPATHTTTTAKPVKAVPVSLSKASPAPARTVTNAFDTSSAQGVANIMASRGQVGHFGGNPGYEGCGMAATPQAAYSICCYSNSGMATVDVGYAQGANGMWYCCRRYR